MRKILIIDDEPDAIAVLELLLKNLNYDVSAITNPSLAIETIGSLSPQLIILDWQMPEMDGIEVLREIRNHIEFAEIPIIIASGVRTNSSDLKQALDFGAMDYLKKPIDEIELEARIASAFSLLDYHRLSITLEKKIHNQELEIAETKTKLLQNELSKKEREMIVAAVSIFQNKHFLINLKKDLFDANVDFEESQQRHLTQVLDKYDNIANSFNWQLFEKRFTELHTDFYNKLISEFPPLTSGELRLCAFFRIGLSMKEIAMLNYSNHEAVRKAAYRIRKKMNLNEKINLSLFLQKY